MLAAAFRAGVIEASPLPLMIWLSPSFPVGSFAYSHALEWAVEAGAVRDLATAQAWVSDLLASGGLRNDAIAIAESWRAVSAGEYERLAACNALMLALAGSRERHLETSAQGNAFLLAIATAWPCPAFVRAQGAICGDVAYPVAIGLTAAAHGIGLPAVLEAAIVAGIANLASALVRLSALGQSDGQRLIAGVLGEGLGLAAFAAGSSLDDIGGAAFQSDIAALRHETQYTRLFRT